MANQTKPILIKGSGKKNRCWWCGDDPQYVDYHDNEWGNPVFDDHRLFEKICLEGFQAGLSWLTILRKRDNFRNAFSSFDFVKVSKYKTRDVERLLKNAGIVRHRGKIESTINNAKRAIEMKKAHGSLASYFWQFEPKKSPLIKTSNDLVAITTESTLLSKDLKKLGWSFVGPTTCYAFMQAMGMVNDHVQSCRFRSKCNMSKAAKIEAIKKSTR